VGRGRERGGHERIDPQMFVDKAKQGGVPASQRRRCGGALGRASKRVDAVYEVPFTATQPMEPMNATITSGPTGRRKPGCRRRVRRRRAPPSPKSPGIAPEKVNLHTTFMGGGFGRRGEGQINHLEDAAHVANRLKVPVKLTWSARTT
jgi:isoquinoline 1-oxidoreductase beta subunit